MPSDLHAYIHDTYMHIIHPCNLPSKNPGYGPVSVYILLVWVVFVLLCMLVHGMCACMCCYIPQTEQHAA